MADIGASRAAAEAARRELDARSPEANRRVAEILRELKSGLSARQQRMLEEAVRPFEGRAAAQESPADSPRSAAS